MNNPTATKRYITNNLPLVAGDITDGTFSTTLNPGFGSSTVHYKRVGNLIFDLWVFTSGGVSFFFRDDSGTITKVESILGVTINTVFAMDNYGAYTGSWTGTAWAADPPSNNTRPLLVAFMVN